MIAASTFRLNIPKSYLLLFDSVFMWGKYILENFSNDDYLSENYNRLFDIEEVKRQIGDLEYLEAEGILRFLEPKIDYTFNDKEAKEWFDAFWRLQRIVDPVKRSMPLGPKTLEEIQRAIDIREGRMPPHPMTSEHIIEANLQAARADNALVRLMSIQLHDKYDIHAIPLLSPTSFDAPKPGQLMSSDVLKIVLGSFPLLNENIPLEKIIDFRKDEELKHKLVLLTRWMYKIATEKLSASEIENELEFLLREYTGHLQLRKMEYKLGVAQILLTSPFELLENVVKLKFKNIFDPLFALQQKRIDFLKGELTAPGREVSFIVSTKETFE